MKRIHLVHAERVFKGRVIEFQVSWTWPNLKLGFELECYEGWASCSLDVVCLYVALNVYPYEDTEPQEDPRSLEDAIELRDSLTAWIDDKKGEE